MRLELAVALKYFVECPDDRGIRLQTEEVFGFFKELLDPTLQLAQRRSAHVITAFQNIGSVDSPELRRVDVLIEVVRYKPLCDSLHRCFVQRFHTGSFI